MFTLPLVDHPTDQDLKLFHSYTPGAGPDGFAFGESGNLYLCLAGYSQISVLSPDSTEVQRFSGAAQNSTDPLHPLPWTNPANIAFDNEPRRIVVTNHASLISPSNPALFAVFDVFVDDKGGKLFGTHDE